MDFWDLKRQQLQQQGKLRVQRQEPPKPGGAWWSDETGHNSFYQRGYEAGLTDSSPEHDFSKAQHLRDKSGACPNCSSGNYVSPGASSANRCFNCGYIQGREINDLNTFAAVADVRTVKVRQAASAQGLRMGRSAAEINQANAKLALSEHGKAKIDN